MPSIHSVDAISDASKNVLIRLDLNVPMEGDDVTDDTRIQRSLGTIEEVLSNGHRVFLLSHRGRPTPHAHHDKWQKEYSLQALVKPLENYLKRPVTFVPDCGGQDLENAIQESKDDVFLLENVRFHKGEVENDVFFSKFLAHHCHAYVNEAFSCSHRAHASVVGITEFLPSYGGRSLMHELTTLKTIFDSSSSPVTAIVGGSKVSTKLAILRVLSQKFDNLLLGGGIANTFLVAKGYDVGLSLYEKGMVAMAKDILKTSKAHIYLPLDARCATDIDGPSSLFAVDQIPKESKIFDIGPKTEDNFIQILKQSKTILWNGPFGVFEQDAFSHGSVNVAKAVAQLTIAGDVKSIAGGGDTASLLHKAKVFNDFTYVSTAGGAFLEWLEGKPLPGVIALQR